MFPFEHFCFLSFDSFLPAIFEENANDCKLEKMKIICQLSLFYHLDNE